ncbi:MAG: glutamine synthetase III [Simkaniaceae bacterium]|nr:glutamine synthetase III [Simkaniaceae bacterium]
MISPAVFQEVDEMLADMNEIAARLKSWALAEGATHYCHWFQPLTGASAEKHESFAVKDLTGKDLMLGEPDASSFPNGGLRCTYEARGYTSFDRHSPPFIWDIGGIKTLCIPSVFYSWTGEALDTKIPLLRSDAKINQAAIRLLHYFEIEAKQVFSTVGCEQEYFVIDAELAKERPDLTQLGKTIFGAPPAKGQELGDHYFGSVKERVLRFMQDFENEAAKLGIPLQTRHNEVAPAQHEVAPLYERAVLAIDHNILLMELMRKVAQQHGLKCLLHEKPFRDVNGSGKHLNWSLQSDTGRNLLDPREPYFIVMLTAVLMAVHSHGALLRASVGSYGNDERLGGHEAPPAIISVYLGEALEKFLEEGIESMEEFLDLGLSHIPKLPRHSTDRNRTSPFAFTGNKFEFRALGASMSPALPTTILNAIVAESLHELMDAIEARGVVPAIQHYLAKTKAIRFSGDNYSEEWREEAARRSLPHFQTAVEAFHLFTAPTTVEAMQEVMSVKELKSLQEVMISTYHKQKGIEEKLFVEIFDTEILPAALRTLELFERNHQAHRSALIRDLIDAITESIQLGQFGVARHILDRLELMIDRAYYPFPKIWELLYHV